MRSRRMYGADIVRNTAAALYSFPPPTVSVNPTIAVTDLLARGASRRYQLTRLGRSKPHPPSEKEQVGDPKDLHDGEDDGKRLGHNSKSSDRKAQRDRLADPHCRQER